CENTWKNDNKKWHMKMIEHNHFICHLILGTFTEYPCLAVFGITAANIRGLLSTNSKRCPRT
ncbi:hypothetical protein, partial [uncultured Bacteroides sp.]|uniref:hypothetical protein n=1 Tax=uncultured Bacteroides sp. TaxID=162156 RepID=UPI002666B859